MHDEDRPLNPPSPGGALPPCCCPLMFCATAGSRPWIDRLSHRFFEVSFSDTLRHLVEAYRARTRMSAQAFGLEAARDRDFVRARLAGGVSVRLDTADEVLERIGEPPFGPLFRAEVEAYLAITGTKAYLLGELALRDASFVTRLRQGLSPTLGNVDRSGAGWGGIPRRPSAARSPRRRCTRTGGGWAQVCRPPICRPQDCRPQDCRAQPCRATRRAHRDGTDAPLRPRPYLTPGELAAEWATSTRTLARLRAEGEGPAYHRFGGQIRYARPDIEAWAAACRVHPEDGGAG